MRKIPHAYTATCGILLPHMRHYAVIHHFSHTVLWPFYTSLCGKIKTYIRQSADFHGSHYVCAIPKLTFMQRKY